MPESDTHQQPVESVDLPKARDGQPAATRPDLDFTPVHNGMDYLRSAVEHLAGQEWEHKVSEPDARALKYAVLHLHAAAEVLLKARLTHEHWSLVFSEPAAASWDKYTDGDFQSCSIPTTLDRLERVARVPFPQKKRTAITQLGETRNALTHYGHSKSAHRVEGQVATMLDLLITFISEHLQPTEGKEAPHVETAMRELRGRLGRVQKLVDKRMNGLAQQLQEHADYTVICPECRQDALVVGQSPACLFCLQTYNAPREAALRWGESIVGGGADDVDWSLEDCTACSASDTLPIPIDLFYLFPEEDRLLCFACRAVYTHSEDQ
ncbi:hypothetical protein OG879_28945 [Streptomyces caniferus]|uniref:hypothetical protein n=1 Tax=Streptomyces caniferus TaxID=285557 RepID=UPI002E2D3516|nr:hypothetical protein [Streptomyces caniferus]